VLLLIAAAKWKLKHCAYCLLLMRACFGLANDLIQNQVEGSARLAEKEQSSELFGPPLG
jgi:hypothetical protein